MNVQLSSEVTRHGHECYGNLGLQLKQEKQELAAQV